MTQEDIIVRLLEIEKQEKVNDLYVESIPVWNILKYRLRGYHNVEMGINDITKSEVKQKIGFSIRIKYICRSIWDVFHLLCRRGTNKICFVGFPRLENVNGILIDKFVDPVIDECGFKNDEYIYFNNEAGHPSNRICNRNIIYTDFIKYLSIILAAFLFPFIWYRNKKTFNRLSAVVKKYYTTNKSAEKYIYLKPTIIFAQYLIYKIIFNRLRIKSLIGVSRPTFFSQALAAKHLGVKVIELQHGITRGLTSLYSGVYNNSIDPDYFCTFGDSCPKDVFNIDQTRVINIGFALNSYIRNLSTKKIYDSKCILIVSEPEPSETILSIVFRLATEYPDFVFHIRRHPQEYYSEFQKDKIESTYNVKDVSSKECSQLAIMPYEYIIGDNSSVLYEALAVGKKVARLNCEGLNAIGYIKGQEDGFFYINNINDFQSFVGSFVTNGYKTIYSPFDAKLFKSILDIDN